MNKFPTWQLLMIIYQEFCGIEGIEFFFVYFKNNIIAKLVIIIALRTYKSDLITK